MGLVSSSASILDYEKPVGHADDNLELKRNLSLSTINEERSSQMYETAASDISTTNDKSEVSFSFDGKEVSVSLYETPDLTQEEAMQIVEMYADQISEHVSENNVVELPPLRFVKETSHSGNLLMEAVLVDVAPEYFSQDTGLETEADIENISSVDDRMPCEMSELSTDSSGKAKSSSKKDDKESFKSADVSKVDSEAGDQNTEADLQTFASAISSERIEQRASESPVQDLEKDSYKMSEKVVTPPSGFDIDRLVANNMALVLPLAKEFTIALKHMKVIEEEVEMQSSLLMSPTSADGSRKIVENLMSPLIGIAQKLQIYNGEMVLDEYLTTLIDDIENLHQGLTVVEKCVAMDQGGHTMVQRTSVCVIDSAGELFLSAFDILNRIAHQYEDTTVGRKLCVLTHDLRYGITITQDTIKAQAVIQEANEFEQNAHLTESIGRLQQVPEVVPFDTMTDADLPTEALNFKNMCRAVVSIQDILDNGNDQTTGEILENIIQPIGDLEREVRVVESKLSNFKGQATWEHKMINSILDSVMPPMYEIFKVLESFDRSPSDLGSHLVEAILPPLQEIQSGLARIGQDIESEATESGLDDPDTKRVITTLTQTLIYFGSNITAMANESHVCASLRSIHGDLTELTRDITMQTMRKSQLNALEILRKNVEDLNYCFRQMEESSVRESCGDLIDPLHVLRETIEYNLAIGPRELHQCLLENIDYSVACIEQNSADKLHEGDISQLTQYSDPDLKSLRIENREVEHLITTLESLHRCIAAIEEHVCYDNTCAEADAAGEGAASSAQHAMHSSPLEPIQNCLLDIKDAVVYVGTQPSNSHTQDLVIIHKIIEPLERIQDTLNEFESEDAAKPLAQQGHISEVRTLAKPLHDIRECIGALQHELSLDEFVEELEDMDVRTKLARPVLELKRNIDALLHEIVDAENVPITSDTAFTAQSTYQFDLKRVEYGSLLSTLRRCIVNCNSIELNVNESSSTLSEHLITEIDVLLCKIEEPEFNLLSTSSTKSILTQLQILEVILHEKNSKAIAVSDLREKAQDLKALLNVTDDQQNELTVPNLRSNILGVEQPQDITKCSTIQQLPSAQIAFIENQISELQNAVQRSSVAITKESIANILQSVAQPLLKAYIATLAERATLETDGESAASGSSEQNVQSEAQLEKLIEAVGIENIVQMVNLTEGTPRSEPQQIGSPQANAHYSSLLLNIKECIITCNSSASILNDNVAHLSQSLVTEIDELQHKLNDQNQTLLEVSPTALLNQLDVFEIVIAESNANLHFVSQLISQTNELKTLLNIQVDEKINISNLKERILAIEHPESITRCHAIQRLAQPKIAFIQHQINELQSVAKNSLGVITKEQIAVVLQPIAQPLLNAYISVISDQAIAANTQSAEDNVSSIQVAEAEPDAQLAQLVDAVGIEEIVHMSRLSEEETSVTGSDADWETTKYATVLFNIKQSMLECNSNTLLVDENSRILSECLLVEVNDILQKSQTNVQDIKTEPQCATILKQLEALEILLREANGAIPIVISLARSIEALRTLLNISSESTISEITISDTTNTAATAKLQRQVSEIQHLENIIKFQTIQNLPQPQITFIENQIAELQSVVKNDISTLTKQSIAIVLQPIAQPLLNAYIRILSDRGVLENIARAETDSVTPETSIESSSELVQLVQAVGIEDIVHLSHLSELESTSIIDVNQTKYAAILSDVKDTIAECNQCNLIISENCAILSSCILIEIENTLSKITALQYDIRREAIQATLLSPLEALEVLLKETSNDAPSVATLSNKANELKELLQIRNEQSIPAELKLNKLRSGILDIQQIGNVAKCQAIQNLPQAQIAFIENQLSQLDNAIKIDTSASAVQENITFVLQPIAQSLLNAYVQTISENVCEQKSQATVEIIKLVQAVGIDDIVQMAVEAQENVITERTDELKISDFTESLANIKQSLIDCKSDDIVMTEIATNLHHCLIEEIDSKLTEMENLQVATIEVPAEKLLINQLDVFELVMKDANIYAPPVVALQSNIAELKTLLNATVAGGPNEQQVVSLKDRILAIQHPEIIYQCATIQQLPQSQIANIDNQLQDFKNITKNLADENLTREEISHHLQSIAQPLLNAYIAVLSDRGTLECLQLPADDEKRMELAETLEPARELLQLVEVVGVEELAEMSRNAAQTQVVDADVEIKEIPDDSKREEFSAILSEIKECVAECQSNEIIMNENAVDLSNSLLAEIEEIIPVLQEANSNLNATISIHKTLLDQLQVFEIIMKETNIFAVPLITLSNKISALKAVLGDSSETVSESTSDIPTLKEQILSIQNLEFIPRFFAIQRLPQPQIAFIQNQITELQNIVKNAVADVTKEEIAIVLQPIAQPLINAYICVLTDRATLDNVANIGDDSTTAMVESIELSATAASESESERAANLVRLVETVGVEELVKMSELNKTIEADKLAAEQSPPIPGAIKLKRRLLSVQQSSFGDKLEEMIALREFAELKPFSDQVHEIRTLIATKDIQEVHELDDDKELEESLKVIAVIAKPLLQIKQIAQSMEGQDAIFVCASNLIEYGHKKTYESLVDLINCIEEISLTEQIELVPMVVDEELADAGDILKLKTETVDEAKETITGESDEPSISEESKTFIEVTPEVTANEDSLVECSALDEPSTAVIIDEPSQTEATIGYVQEQDASEATDVSFTNLPESTQFGISETNADSAITIDNLTNVASLEGSDGVKEAETMETTIKESGEGTKATEALSEAETSQVQIRSESETVSEATEYNDESKSIETIDSTIKSPNNNDIQTDTIAPELLSGPNTTTPISNTSDDGLGDERSDSISETMDTIEEQSIVVTTTDLEKEKVNETTMDVNTISETADTQIESSTEELGTLPVVAIPSDGKIFSGEGKAETENTEAMQIDEQKQAESKIDSEPQIDSEVKTEIPQQVESEPQIQSASEEDTEIVSKTFTEKLHELQKCILLCDEALVFDNVSSYSNILDLSTIAKPVHDIQKSIVTHQAEIFQHATDLSDAASLPLQDVASCLQEVKLFTANVNSVQFALCPEPIKSLIEALNNFDVEELSQLADGTESDISESLCSSLKDDRPAIFAKLVETLSTVQQLRDFEEHVMAIESISSVAALKPILHEIQQTINACETNDLELKIDSVDVQKHLIITQIAEPLMQIKHLAVELNREEFIKSIEENVTNNVQKAAAIVLTDVLHCVDSIYPELVEVCPNFEPKDLSQYATQDAAQLKEATNKAIFKNELLISCNALEQSIDYVKYDESLVGNLPERILNLKNALVSVSFETDTDYESVNGVINDVKVKLDTILHRNAAETQQATISNDIQELNSNLCETIQCISDANAIPSQAVLDHLDQAVAAINLSCEFVSNLSSPVATHFDGLSNILKELKTTVATFESNITDHADAQISRNTHECQQLLADLQSIESQLFFVMANHPETSQSVTKPLTALKSQIGEIQNVIQLTDDIHPLLIAKATKNLCKPLQAVINGIQEFDKELQIKSAVYSLQIPISEAEQCVEIAQQIEITKLGTEDRTIVSKLAEILPEILNVMAEINHATTLTIQPNDAKQCTEFINQLNDLKYNANIRCESLTPFNESPTLADLCQNYSKLVEPLSNIQTQLQETMQILSTPFGQNVESIANVNLPKVLSSIQTTNTVFETNKSKSDISISETAVLQILENVQDVKMTLKLPQSKCEDQLNSLSFNLTTGKPVDESETNALVSEIRLTIAEIDKLNASTKLCKKSEISELLSELKSECNVLEVHFEQAAKQKSIAIENAAKRGFFEEIIKREEIEAIDVASFTESLSSVAVEDIGDKSETVSEIDGRQLAEEVNVPVEHVRISENVQSQTPECITPEEEKHAEDISQSMEISQSEEQITSSSIDVLPEEQQAIVESIIPSEKRIVEVIDSTPPELKETIEPIEETLSESSASEASQVTLADTSAQQNITEQQKENLLVVTDTIEQKPTKLQPEYSTVAAFEVVKPTNLIECTADRVCQLEVLDHGEESNFAYDRKTNKAQSVIDSVNSVIVKTENILLENAPSIASDTSDYSNIQIDAITQEDNKIDPNDVTEYIERGIVDEIPQEVNIISDSIDELPTEPVDDNATLKKTTELDGESNRKSLCMNSVQLIQTATELIKKIPDYCVIKLKSADIQSLHLTQEILEQMERSLLTLADLKDDNYISTYKISREFKAYKSMTGRRLQRSPFNQVSFEISQVLLPIAEMNVFINKFMDLILLDPNEKIPANSDVLFSSLTPHLQNINVFLGVLLGITPTIIDSPENLLLSGVSQSKFDEIVEKQATIEEDSTGEVDVESKLDTTADKCESDNKPIDESQFEAPKKEEKIVEKAQEKSTDETDAAAKQKIAASETTITDQSDEGKLEKVKLDESVTESDTIKAKATEKENDEPTASKAKAKKSKKSEMEETDSKISTTEKTEIAASVIEEICAEKSKDSPQPEATPVDIKHDEKSTEELEKTKPTETKTSDRLKSEESSPPHDQSVKSEELLPTEAEVAKQEKSKESKFADEKAKEEEEEDIKAKPVEPATETTKPVTKRRKSKSVKSEDGQKEAGSADKTEPATDKPTDTKEDLKEISKLEEISPQLTDVPVTEPIKSVEDKPKGADSSVATTEETKPDKTETKTPVAKQVETILEKPEGKTQVTELKPNDAEILKKDETKSELKSTISKEADQTEIDSKTAKKLKSKESEAEETKPVDFATNEATATLIKQQEVAVEPIVSQEVSQGADKSKKPKQEENEVKPKDMERRGKSKDGEKRRSSKKLVEKEQEPAEPSASKEVSGKIEAQTEDKQSKQHEANIETISTEKEAQEKRLDSVAQSVEPIGKEAEIKSDEPVQKTKTKNDTSKELKNKTKSAEDAATEPKKEIESIATDAEKIESISVNGDKSEPPISKVISDAQGARFKTELIKDHSEPFEKVCKEILLIYFD